MTTLADFKVSLTADEPPPGLPPALEALWWDARDDWMRAHDLAQARDDGDGAWVHGYLHRKEGDLDNADYWYRRAGRRLFDGPLALEWDMMVEELLAR